MVFRTSETMHAIADFGLYRLTDIPHALRRGQLPGSNDAARFAQRIDED